MVRYRVRPDRVADNEQLVAGVFAELARTSPPGLAYTTFKLEDGVTFVHLAEVDVAANAGKHPLQTLAAFAEFTRDIAARCDEPPVTTTLEIAGNYRGFGGIAAL